VRIASWNIRQGGGRRLGDICDALIRWTPDVVALQEVRRRGVVQLSERLAEAGLTYNFFDETSTGHENALFLASREPLDAGEFMPERTGLCHILEAQTMGLTILPVHFPQKSAQVPLFEALLDDSTSLLKYPCLMIGDLNCGLPFIDSTHKTFVNSRYLQGLKDAGWIDLYRQQHGEAAREYTWISPRSQRGFRYDHALAGNDVADRLTDFTYVHEVRESGLSDHSGLVLVLD